MELNGVAIDFCSGVEYPLLKGDKGFVSCVEKELLNNEVSTKNGQAFCEEMKKISGLEPIFTLSIEQGVSLSVSAARNYSQKNYSKSRNEILFIEENFYKRFSKKIISGTAATRCAETNHVGNFISSLSEKTCAVCIESVNAETFLAKDKSFFKQVAEICAARDILLIVFETCTCPLRYGKYFYYLSCGITPDTVICAGSVANGLPLTVILQGEKVYSEKAKISEVPEFIFCGAEYVYNYALENVERIKKNIKALAQAIKACKKIKQYTCSGLNYVIKVQDAEKEIASCKEKGLILCGGKGKIVIAPPINLSQEDFNFAITVIREVFGGNAQNPFEI